jgi:glycosyltransferase involved in cell wall biosynthesis
MKKILFYIHNGWVFGKIHNELIKVLCPEFYCDILCWSTPYSDAEIHILQDKYDYILSTPHGCWILHKNYNIPMEKMMAILHQDWDVYTAIKTGMTPEYFDRLAGYGCVSPILQNISLSYGISRIPDVTRIGIFQNNYPKNISTELKTVGNFCKSKRVDQGYDVKRGELIEEIVNKTGLSLSRSDSVNFLCVESLYKDIHLVISPSLVEGNPYPMLEAFACGIPVLSTATGIAPEYLRTGGGAILPLKEKDFVNCAVQEIEKMKNDIEYYKARCHESYQIGVAIDWSNIKNEWLYFLNNLK